MSWKRFTYKILLFLLPVVLVFSAVEILVREAPSSISISSQHLKKEHAQIETLILGASQNKRAINPEYLSTNTLSVAGTRQGHKTDYYLLKDLHRQLPNLKKVVISTTYRHFESRPNPKHFWKYKAHLLYYDVNAFERRTYFKDNLLYLSNPSFYTDQLENYYLKKNKPTYNKYGYQLTGQLDRFAKLEYDEQAILDTYKVKMNKLLNKKHLKFTTGWFNKVLNYCKNNNLQVTITKTPTIEHYRLLQDRDILHRRDSIVDVVLKKYPNIQLFDQEENSDYTITDFINENHLNHKGAEKFTKRLDNFIFKNQ